MDQSPDKSIELPEPWYWTELDLSYQLRTEISKNHALYNKSVKTIARRQDKDDVLFELDVGKFAIVHLTWQKQRHADNRWPTTKLYNNWQEVYARVQMDAMEF